MREAGLVSELTLRRTSFLSFAAILSFSLAVPRDSQAHRDVSLPRKSGGILSAEA